MTRVFCASQVEKAAGTVVPTCSTCTEEESAAEHENAEDAKIARQVLVDIVHKCASMLATGEVADEPT
jgi:hypothetical protein